MDTRLSLELLIYWWACTLNQISNLGTDNPIRLWPPQEVLTLQARPWTGSVLFLRPPFFEFCGHDPGTVLAGAQQGTADTARHGTTWHDMVRHDKTRHDTAQTTLFSENSPTVSWVTRLVSR